MDVISFSEASTANGRIETFNANPDSASGIVTVPKVIASGETITIPAGRIAVLPNVQVDGVLNVTGEVFVPSGSTYGNRNMIEKLTYVATAGQSVFSAVYDLGSIDVFVNGIRLSSSDYVATSLTSVTITGGVNAGDIVDLVSYGAFTVANTYTKAETDNKIALGDIFVANDSRAMTALNATGTAPIYACRAWVNFNGTGTVAIRASGNVSSITDNGVGYYRVNFTTPMPDANYATTSMCSNDNIAGTFIDFNQLVNGGVNTTTSCNIEALAGGGTPSDRQYIYVTIFR